MIRDAAVFSLNEIVLKPEGWPLFEPVADEAELPVAPPNARGVYILALPRFYLSYPGGSSRVLYIGRAVTGEGLRRRLGEHFRFTEQRRASRGDTGSAVHGIQATWSTALDNSVKESSRIETRLLYWFAEIYGAAPLGNAQSAWVDAKADSPIVEDAEPVDT
jgi:hypothetical protein